MKKASIIGLGDILKGDRGIGCYILEALAQERLGKSVHLTYLGDEPRYAADLLYEADFAIVVSAFNLDGLSGNIHYWCYEVLQQNVGWIINESVSIRRLINVLAKTEMAGGFPKELSYPCNADSPERFLNSWCLFAVSGRRVEVESNYSYLNASIGSRRAAWRAGK